MNRERQRGFTLLEITIVLVIVGILAGLLMVSMGDRSAVDRLQLEAQRLQQLTQLASEDAQLRGVQIGLEFTQTGYKFLTLDHKGLWTEYEQSGSLRPRTLPRPYRINVRVQNHMAPPAPDRQSAKDVKPQVLIYSSGEVTPFRAVLSIPGVATQYQVDVDGLGRAKVQSMDKAP